MISGLFDLSLPGALASSRVIVPGCICILLGFTYQVALISKKIFLAFVFFTFMTIITIVIINY